MAAARESFLGLLSVGAKSDSFGQLRLEQLQGNHTLLFCIPRFVDLPTAAFAELLNSIIVQQPLFTPVVHIFVLTESFGRT